MKIFLYIASILFLLISGGTAYFVQQVIAFTPDSEDQVREWRKLNSYENLGWAVEDITFTTYENSIENAGNTLNISGLLIRAENPDAPTVIALHGKGSNRVGVLRFGNLFRKLGFNVLIYDQRHHGRSEGDFTTYGFYESHDVKAAIDFLEAKGLNTEQLGIIGESFGAATSLMAGAIDDRIKFVIADSSYIDMPTAVRDNAWRMNYVPHHPIPDLGFLVAGFLADFNPYEVSPINHIKTINKPVLIVHCDLDVWAYPQYAYQLYEASDKNSTELKMFPDCEHVAAYDDYTQDYETMVAGFLERHVPELITK